MSIELGTGDDKAPQTRSIAVYVGRQAIYDRALGVHSYELLYRGSAEDVAVFTDGSRATANVLSNTLMELGIEVVTGGRPAFVNLTRDLIVSGFTELLPPHRFVIEILEDVTPDSEVIAALEGLKSAGYRIALDDFVYSDAKKPLVELADYVKLDLVDLGREQLERSVQILSGYPAALLAEKVETHEEFDLCKKLGFSYFQGYFLCRPQVMRGRQPPIGRLGALELLAKANDPGIEVDQLAELFSRDVALSYKLLRYINSAAFSLPAPVDSVHRAIVLLGPRSIRAWLSLVVLAGITGKPGELITTAIMRAKMCEELALSHGSERPDAYFTVGLFSTLDALLDEPMESVLEPLPLSEEVSAALLTREGSLGEALACTIAYERGDWDAVMEMADGEAARDAYWEALRWLGALMTGTERDSSHE